VQPLSLSQVGEGADMRFAPAVAKLARRTAVAWTTRGDTMRVSLAIVDPDGTLVATHRVTPTSMGGAAPVFAAGSGPAWLLFLDADVRLPPTAVEEVLSQAERRGLDAASTAFVPDGDDGLVHLQHRLSSAYFHWSSRLGWPHSIGAFLLVRSAKWLGIEVHRLLLGEIRHDRFGYFR